MIILVRSVGWMTQVGERSKNRKATVSDFPSLVYSRESAFFSPDCATQHTGRKHQTLDMYFVKIESCVKLHSCPAKAVPFFPLSCMYRDPISCPTCSLYVGSLFISASAWQREKKKMWAPRKSPTRFRGICNINLHYGENQVPLLFSPPLVSHCVIFRISRYNESHSPKHGLIFAAVANMSA